MFCKSLNSSYLLQIIVLLLVNLGKIPQLSAITTETDITVAAVKKAYNISVGFIYCSEVDLFDSQNLINRLNSEETVDSKVKINIDIKGLKLRATDTPLSSSMSVCDYLMGLHNIYAVVFAGSGCLSPTNVSFVSENEQLSIVSAISFTCAYYNIPVIDLAGRKAEFSDKTIYNSFIRMLPPYFHQAHVWIELVRKLKFTSVNLIYSSDLEGKLLASKFEDLADLYSIKVNKLL